MDSDTRLYNCERDIKDIVDRLGKVEDKASGAWKTIAEVNSRMDKVEQKVDSLERDVKELKVGQQQTNKYMKWMFKGLLVMAAVILVTGLIALKNGSDIPEKVVDIIVPMIADIK